ncbi:MAG: galactose-1-phosphate uridylyltransferase, partial [Euryarchaeota archaeon]|nr:galactose-1-phosphate uridylyltransferase [Euryarchaeota archaeon]
FCPGNPEIPRRFDVVALPNRFPSLSPDGPGARGVCEVLLYSPRHRARLYDLPLDHVTRLVDLWADRTRRLGALDYVKYVYLFENRGEAIGVTLTHPHGQLYALPFVPPVLQREVENFRAHHRRTGRCLLCDQRRRERGQRILGDTHVEAYVPSYGRWPYEGLLLPRRHVQRVPDLTPPERRSLAGAIQGMLRRYDRLVRGEMPLMMVVHQAPTDGRPHPSYHLHVEFYPLLEGPGRVKHRAGLESGAGTFTVTARPEDRARELRS